MTLCACGREAMPNSQECRTCYEDSARHAYRERNEPVSLGRPVPKLYLSEAKIRTQPKRRTE